MKKLIINIFYDEDIINNTSYDVSIYGERFSSKDKLIINKTSEGYAINYDSDNFMELSLDNFIEGLLKFLRIKDLNILLYYYPLNNFRKDVGDKVLELSNILEDYNKLKYLNYKESDSIKYLQNYYEDNEIDSYDFEYENDEENIIDYIKKNKSKKKKFKKSMIFDKSTNPKKIIKRHGIVVYKNKKTLRHDKEIIKDFLKYFIPGKEDWIKKFRNDLLERWIDAYALSKKNLNKLQKKFKSKGFIDKLTDNTIRLTEAIVKEKNNWNNPNK